jgi:hypothetical protein
MGSVKVGYRDNGENVFDGHRLFPPGSEWVVVPTEPGFHITAPKEATLTQASMRRCLI